MFDITLYAIHILEKNIKVLFDLDDTLINHSQAEVDAAIKFGKKFSSVIPDYDEHTFVDLWKKTSEKYFMEFLAGRMTFKEQRVQRIRDIFQDQNMTDNESFAYFNKYHIYYEDSWNLFLDVIETLEFLKAQNIDIGILSDGSQQQQEHKLEKTGINDYFEFVITAESEGMSKPNPLFFQRAADKFGVKLKDVIYIGDNLNKDAIGATDAGLLGIWLNRNQSDLFFERSFTTLQELKDISCLSKLL